MRGAEAESEVGVAILSVDEGEAGMTHTKCDSAGSKLGTGVQSRRAMLKSALLGGGAAVASLLEVRSQRPLPRSRSKRRKRKQIAPRAGCRRRTFKM